MIAPTNIYDAFPTLSPVEAAQMIADAIIDKPKRMATRLAPDLGVETRRRRIFDNERI